MSRLETRQLFAAVPDRVLFQGLDLTVAPGQSWGVLGPNGAGKTTLLHTLAGLRGIQHGDVVLDGKALGEWSHRARAQRIGLLLQDTWDAFPASVLETALIGRHPHLGRWSWESLEDYELAERALAAMALEGFEQRRTDTLSGGERRRLAIATLLVQDPDIYLLDEPTNHLDLHHQISLLKNLTGWVRDEGRCLVMVLHDVNLAARFCDHLLLLYGDSDAEHGPLKDLLTQKRLERLYRQPIRLMKTKDGPVAIPRLTD
jgi:iron complex transport system ATP-binding protein